MSDGAPPGETCYSDPVKGFRNVVVVSLAFFLLKRGEQLWDGFLPRYMQELGASAMMIGLFGALKDLLDAVYQYPGGALADRIGSQRALMAANALTIAGYGVYWLAPVVGWPILFAGVPLVMAWESFSLPATFTLIGQSLPADARTLGFSVQSTLRRLPMVLAPPLGGLLIGHWGSVGGVRAGLLFSVCAGAVALGTQRTLYQYVPTFSKPDTTGMLERVRLFSSGLRRLLIADIMARLAEGTAEIFVVLYLMSVVGLSALQFGTLVMIQTVVSIAVYLPGGWLARRFGHYPVVLATFLFFGLFPWAVWQSHSYGAAVAAFVVGGLREIGEPARKALITDLGHAGRDYGLYYLLRGLAVAPAALAGGWLWQHNPGWPFAIAGALGVTGACLYLIRSTGAKGT
jgi:MFS family permease